MLLQKGIRWIVGYGSSIRALMDPCIPSFSSSFRPSLHIYPSNLTVSELISVYSGSHVWNNKKLYTLFSNHDRQLIKKIPLSMGDHKDELIWHITINGNYYDKPGYWLSQLNKLQSSPNSSSVSKWWRQI